MEVQANLADGEDGEVTMEVMPGRNCFDDASFFRCWHTLQEGEVNLFESIFGYSHARHPVQTRKEE